MEERNCTPDERNIMKCVVLLATIGQLNEWYESVVETKHHDVDVVSVLTYLQT